MDISIEKEKFVKIKYKDDWKGETSDYTILPIRLYFCSIEYLPDKKRLDKQWLLEAYLAIGDGEYVLRYFAIKNILAWWVP
jgi:hypothetical protein